MGAARWQWRAGIAAGGLMLAACGRVGFGVPRATEGVRADPDGADAIEPLADAAVPDAIALDDTACDDLYADAILCEGFEAGTLDRWSDVHGAVVSSTERAYRGKGAVRSEATAAADEAGLEALGLGRISSGALYMRAYLYVPAEADVAGTTLFYLTEPYEPGGEEAFFVSLDVDGPDRLDARLDPDTYVFPGTDHSFPRDAWFCLRVEMNIALANGSLSVWVDDDLIIARSEIDTSAPIGYDELTFPVHRASDSGATSAMWGDEVVVDTRPIECDP